METTTNRRHSAEATNTELVQAAESGDGQAWQELFDRYSGLVRHVVRSFRLDEAAAEDASQTAWLKAVENLDKIRDPEAIGAWLATTARNAAIAEWRKTKRQVPVGSEVERFDVAIEAPDRVVDDEERHAVVKAFRTLKEDDKELLRLSVAEEDRSYEDIAGLISRPIGSIGPSRARALSKLREQYETIMTRPPLVNG